MLQARRKKGQMGQAVAVKRKVRHVITRVKIQFGKRQSCSRRWDFFEHKDVHMTQQDSILFRARMIIGL
jgi:hypothetical protein